jgi:Ca2+-binding EF-hand superfamily protein
MRKLHYWLLGGAASALVGAAFAQEESLFERLDKNKDGFVTSDEVEGERKPLFERLLRNADKNKDGKLDREEFSVAIKSPERPATEAKQTERPKADPARTQPGAEAGREQFRRMDRNGDGKLQREELPERMREFLGRIDSDGDGVISEAEFSRAAGRFAGGANGGMPANGAGFAGPLFGALDTNRDGEISAEEIANSSKSLLALDRNRDGKLSRDELGPPPGRPGAEEMLRRLKAADANGDGKLTKEEAPDRLKENFDTIDRNGDGAIDEAELRQMLRRLFERPPQ